MKFINALVVKLVDTKDLKSLPFWEHELEILPKFLLKYKFND